MQGGPATLRTNGRGRVQHTAVTDAGLAHLRDLKRLKSLWLSGTGVTKAGVDELRALDLGTITATLFDMLDVVNRELAASEINWWACSVICSCSKPASTPSGTSSNQNAAELLCSVSAIR